MGILMFPERKRLLINKTKFLQKKTLFFPNSTPVGKLTARNTMITKKLYLHLKKKTTVLLNQ